MEYEMEKIAYYSILDNQYGMRKVTNLNGKVIFVWEYHTRLYDNYLKVHSDIVNLLYLNSNDKTRTEIVVWLGKWFSNKYNVTVWKVTETGF